MALNLSFRISFTSLGQNQDSYFVIVRLHFLIGFNISFRLLSNICLICRCYLPSVGWNWISVLKILISRYRTAALSHHSNRHKLNSLLRPCRFKKNEAFGQWKEFSVSVFFIIITIILFCFDGVFFFFFFSQFVLFSFSALHFEFAITAERWPIASLMKSLAFSRFFF